MDVLSSLSCFKWNATSLEELREGHSRLVPAVCGPRENKAYTAVDEEYFFDKEDPIFSHRCRVWMYVDAHKDSLRRYTRYFVVSVCIVATVAGLFVCVDEVGVWAGVNGSCGTEISNMLIDTQSAEGMEVAKIRKQIVHSGNRRLLARLLWSTVGVNEWREA